MSAQFQGFSLSWRGRHGGQLNVRYPECEADVVPTVVVRRESAWCMLFLS